MRCAASTHPPGEAGSERSAAAPLPLGTCSGAAPLPPLPAAPRQRPQLPHPAGGAASSPPLRAAPRPGPAGHERAGRRRAAGVGRDCRSASHRRTGTPGRGSKPGRRALRGHGGHSGCSAPREQKIHLRVLRALLPLSAPRGGRRSSWTAWREERRLWAGVAPKQLKLLPTSSGGYTSKSKFGFFRERAARQTSHFPLLYEGITESEEFGDFLLNVTKR